MAGEVSAPQLRVLHAVYLHHPLGRYLQTARTIQLQARC